MNFLNKLFGKNEAPINNYEDFWKWFQKNEKAFFKAVKDHSIIEEAFFNKLSPKLEELREGYFFLTGMKEEQTAELILTADGNIKNIVFVEELVAAAPQISGWEFTALKPSHEVENTGIRMHDYEFTGENLWFYPTEYDEFPDQIDLNIVHSDLTEENEDEIRPGTFIFLDHFLGEIDFATTIDGVDFVTKANAEKELIPIKKLKDFLKWRQKEFIEKYEGTRYNTDDDSHSALEGETENGKPLIAIVNSALLQWDGKASHQWMMTIEIKYEEGNESGLPDGDTMHLMDEIEDEIGAILKDSDGYLNVGRQTAEGLREIYFACKEFRKPSKVVDEISSKYASKIEIDFKITKDKYWQSLSHFMPR